MNKTIDYVTVYEIVKNEMAIRSKLIENVAKRIADSLKKNLSLINLVEVTVTKINPPVKGEIGSASVSFIARN